LFACHWMICATTSACPVLPLRSHRSVAMQILHLSPYRTFAVAVSCWLCVCRCRLPWINAGSAPAAPTTACVSRCLFARYWFGLVLPPHVRVYRTCCACLPSHCCMVLRLLRLRVAPLLLRFRFLRSAFCRCVLRLHLLPPPPFWFSAFFCSVRLLYLPVYDYNCDYFLQFVTLRYRCSVVR